TMLSALLLVASLSLGPAPAIHPAPAVTHAADASQPAAQAVDFAAWLGSLETAAPSLGFEPVAVACRTSCSQCPASAHFCCPQESGCVSCTTHPTPCII